MKAIKKIIFVILVFFSFTAYSQDNRIYHLGSGKALRGNIYVLSCFVSDRNNEWTRQEKLQVYNKLYRTQNWLIAQARRYNVWLNFEGGNFGLDRDIKLNHIDYGTGSGREDVNVVTTVLRAIGYSNSLSFYNWALNNSNSSNVIVLVFVKGAGTSYAIPYNDPRIDSELYYLEGAVIYSHYSNGLELYDATIAHEILHLFGAWDIYETFMQTRDREESARRLFPNSIMLRIAQNIDTLEVDELTAWLIGWHNEAKDWYEWFNPYNH